MNEILFVCYPKCTTCKKAQTYLEDNGLPYSLRDIKLDNPNYDELSKWLELSQVDIKRFFNTSGLRYKELNLKDKLSTMTTIDKLQLLASDGMLIKRPLVITQNSVLIGFKLDEWNKLLN